MAVMKTDHRTYRASLFFQRDFPFHIEKFVHSSAQYDDTMRFTREFWKIIYVVSGRGSKIINSSRYPIRPGSLFIIHPEDSTTFVIESKRLEIYNILFLPGLLGGFLGDLKSDFDFFSIFNKGFQRELPVSRREQLYILDSSREVGHLIRRLEKEYLVQAASCRCMIKLRLGELLILISRLGARKIRRNRSAEVADYVDHIIEEHFSEDFNLRHLAENVGFSKSHLCRLYRVERGTTVMENLRRRRIGAAKNMLKTSSDTISEICYSCGFNDLSYFYRAFAGETGLNPGNYRKKFGLD